MGQFVIVAARMPLVDVVEQIINLRGIEPKATAEEILQRVRKTMIDFSAPGVRRVGVQVEETILTLSDVEIALESLVCTERILKTGDVPTHYTRRERPQETPVLVIPHNFTFSTKNP